MKSEMWTEGQSVSASKGVPGVVTDCSGWESDIPADAWSEGHSVTASKGAPGSVTDCSTQKTTISSEQVRKHIIAVFEATNLHVIEKYGTILTRDQFKRLVFEETKVRV